MSLKSSILANQRALMGLTEPEMIRLLPVLKELRHDTAKLLEKFLSRESPEATYTIHRHGALIHQLDKAIATAERKIPWAMQLDLRSGVVSVAPTAVRNLHSMITEGEKRFRSATTSLRLDVAKIIGSSTESLTHRHRSSALRYAGRVGDAIRHDLMVGVVRGESIGGIAKRLMRGGHEDPEAIANALADKQFFRSEADAARLVRTEMNYAYNDIQLDALDEANSDDPGWMKMWDSTNDLKTCIVCARLHGEVRRPHETFPGGVTGPPIHPNDRCGLVPWREGWPRGVFATDYEEPYNKGLIKARNRVVPIEPIITYDDGDKRLRRVPQKLAEKIRNRRKSDAG